MAKIDNFAVIIGAMKCGTTSLFSYLAQHPAVAPSDPKEPHYFTRELDAGKSFDWYLERWDWDAQTHHIALEASTSYTRMPRFANAAKRMAAVSAEFRFLYVLRDPVERIESTLAHQILRGRRPAEGDHADEIPEDWIAMSKYATQVDEYFKRFPAKRILLLDFAELKERPAGLVQRVCRFLDIDDSYPFKGLNTAHNVSRRDHPVYTALSRNGLARAAARLVPRWFKQRVRNRLSRELGPAARLSEKQRSLVSQALADDMKRLCEVYGFDTSRWGRPAPAPPA